MFILKSGSSKGYNGKCWEGHQKECGSVETMIQMGKKKYPAVLEEIEKERISD